jgi:hypothetical protein
MVQAPQRRAYIPYIDIIFDRMHSNTSPRSHSITRRRFLHGIYASGLLLASQRAMAQENAIAPLRKLAGGKPLTQVSFEGRFFVRFT